MKNITEPSFRRHFLFVLAAAGGGEGERKWNPESDIFVVSPKETKSDSGLNFLSPQ